jgi:hypothetical protein
MIVDTNTISNEDAGRLFFELCRRFKWQGAYFSALDIEGYWHDRYGDDEDYQPLTPEQVEQVMEQRMWRVGLGDALCQEAYAVVQDVVHMTCRLHGWKDKA